MVSISDQIDRLSGRHPSAQRVAGRGWLEPMSASPSRMSAPDKADDLVARPWEYPGRPAAFSGLLLGGAYVPLQAPDDGDWGTARLARPGRSGADGQVVGDAGDTLDDVLAASGSAPVRQRTLVLAVGSNASPAVMRRKFAALGVAPVVPFVAVAAEGLAVGHSAHVSLSGFVAATGFRQAGVCTPTFVSLLEPTQLDCLDVTEPNYERRLLTCDEVPVTLDGDALAPQIQLYDSRWGVLSAPAGSQLRSPRTLLPQDDLYSWLVEHCPPWRSLVEPGSDHRATMGRLAADRRLREAVRDAWREQGWSRCSGLAGRTP